MQFAEAIKQAMPLQVLVPQRTNPLERQFRCVAEVFLVDTASGTGVVWLEPYWPAEVERRVAQICYADPVAKDPMSWIDNSPRFGPFCIAYQKPFLMGRLTSESPLWRALLDWQAWRHARRSQCLRSLAWERAANELMAIEPQRLI
ncbi:hypothetical protein [Thiorhodococcus minor]|uniref:Uncharacterized protein n=1 Tax=Thiorhodococcus minor TaxID=57489 RepID=A0A6M0K3Y7_9GAMM|nr:hypothetical protein [Thiorhodococcus minor]NEV64486.1 hypothetical protein [Thiorhodococcus minor]